jgi:hypothetical protein
MDENSIDTTSRRSFVKGAALLAAIAIVLALTGAKKALAQGKLTREAVKYQDSPKGGKDCDVCIQFIPPSTPKAEGSCKVVEGAISPHGYCVAFAPMPKLG